jgi:sigma-B regulation protein RsbU (phosphoserine phosphatase)
MSREGGPHPFLPASVLETLDEFSFQLDLDLHVWSLDEEGSRTAHVYPALEDGFPIGLSEVSPDSVLRSLSQRNGQALQLEIRSSNGSVVDGLASVVQSGVERALAFAQEVKVFTYELWERYEEINLLYSISETLGSVLNLEEAADKILKDVCDVLGAESGALWVYDRQQDLLRLTASVGSGAGDPMDAPFPDRITTRVFEEGRFLGGGRDEEGEPSSGGASTDISVPISYTPPSGDTRIVGVIDLFGRVSDDPFTTSDQKLLSAIASQVGAALENNRLIQESLAQERMSHEMELAHHLQMKLLTSPEAFDRADVAARVVPAEQVGGDFFHLFKLPDGKIGVMIGDVSSHGFPAALIMALALSAASIYALESPNPGEVLRLLDRALSGELETTEMFVSLCYVVIDPAAGELRYSNAGHPHAWVFPSDGDPKRLEATDPPMGFAGPDSYSEGRVPWKSGDLLLLFTDGLSDTLATPEPGSGEAAVLDAVKSELERGPASIVEVLFDLAEVATPYIPADDRTAVVLRT